MLRTLFSATILAGALAASAMAQPPDAGCVLPSEPKGIPAAIDAAITGPADKDRACMKALLIPEARYGNIAHLWSSYALYSDGKQVARGINSIQAIKEAGGWRVMGIMLQAESATAPLPKEYLP